MSIADLRREYNLTGLRRKDLEADPIRQFQRWFDQVQGARASGQMRKFFVRLYKRLLLMGGAELLDLTAMTLATADKAGRPSARVVLLKGVDERGFVFYTNYESRPGVLLAGPGTGGVHRRGREQVAFRRIRCLLQEPSPGKPDWRVGLASKRGDLRPGGAGGKVAANRGPIPGRGCPAPAVLGRLPPPPDAHGVLAGARKPAS